MSSSTADQTRADLREAYDAGDLTQVEYLAELRKLRESTTAAAAPLQEPRAEAAHQVEDEEEDDDEELVDEDGSVYRPAKQQKLNDSAGSDASRISKNGSPHGSFTSIFSGGFGDDLCDGSIGGSLGGTPVHSPVEEPVVEESLCKPGAKAKHTGEGGKEKEVTVVKIGTEADFANNGRVHIKWSQLKPGKKRSYETRYAWVQPGTLTLAPEEGVRSPRIATRVARELSAEAQQAQQTQREQQREQQAQAPLRAAHERERKLPQKQAARRRQSSERTTINDSLERPAPETCGRPPERVSHCGCEHK